MLSINCYTYLVNMYLIYESLDIVRRKFEEGKMYLEVIDA
jgi:hypothetical protein